MSRRGQGGDRLSPTQYMLLSMLIQQPRTGYEIGRLCAPPANHIWAATMSQLYPELAALAAQGLVTFETSDGRGPLDKKTYRISDAGRDVLLRLLRGPRPEETPRNSLAISALCAWLLPAGEAGALWQREAVRLEGDAIALRQRWARNRVVYQRPAAPSPDHPAFGPWATLELAARQKDGEAAFARDLAARYEATAGSPAGATGVEPTGDGARLAPIQRFLLALLAVRPRTGYDFGAAAKPPGGHLVWAAKLSQIYPELTKLAGADLATFETSPGRGPLAKKTYRISEAGREALRRDLRLPRPPESQRQMLALWAHASWALGPAEAALVWRREAVALAVEVAVLAELWQDQCERFGWPEAPSPDAPAFGPWAALQAVACRRRAEAAFAKELAAAYAGAASMVPA
jgi:DNA-binding PadR family transcriptional regulator